MTEEQKDPIIEGKFFAIISYVSFFCIVALVLKRDNKFALYHAKHGLVLFLGEVGCFIVSVVPIIGPILNLIGFLAFCLASIYGVLQSLMGKYSRIPVVTEITEKITL